MIVRKETNLTEKIKSKTLFQSEIETIISSEESNKELAHRYNVSKRTIQRVKAGLIDGIEDEDYQLCDESIKMKYQLQRSREANQRINKTNRETFRIADLIQTMTDEFIEVVENSKHHNFTTKIHPNKTNEVGVIQLSDLHFGERVTEVNGNEFNFEVKVERYSLGFWLPNFCCPFRGSVSLNCNSNCFNSFWATSNLKLSSLISLCFAANLYIKSWSVEIGLAWSLTGD